MFDSIEPKAVPAPPASGQLRGREGLLARHRWLAFLVPLAVYMLAGGLEPKPPQPEAPAGWLAIPYHYYPVVYTFKLALTLGAILLVLPGYRGFSFRVRPLAVLVGAVGVVVWVGLCELKLEERWLVPLGLGRLVDLGTRSGYNPFAGVTPEDVHWAWTFLAVRFFGLVLVVPVIEEFFLRGFVMRFAMDRDWWNVPFGKANTLAIVLGTAVPLLSHPELLATLVWFSMITWLMLRTRNIWDCVAAHAITNLILGVYVVLSGGDAWRMM